MSNEKTIKQRLGEIRSSLRQKRLDGLIVTKPANVTYTTGFCGDDSWAIIGSRGAWLVTDDRYTEQAKKECAGCRIVERRGTLVRATAKIMAAAKSIRTLGVEDSTSLAVFKGLKKNLAVSVKATGNIIEQVRGCKDSDEVRVIRWAAKIALRALRQSLSRSKAGISENELAGVLDFEVRKLGARNSFETIVAFGANGSRPHHRPGGAKLKTNDTVLIDFGVKYKNYCCDLTRCFAVGRTSAFYKKVYSAVCKAQTAAIRMVMAGVEISRVDAAARDVLASYKLPIYAHGTGHGLGLEVHELPIISKNIKGRLRAGQVITIEPAVYIPGKFGVRIEDDVLVTKTGCKVLSQDRFFTTKAVPVLNL